MNHTGNNLTDKFFDNLYGLSQERHPDRVILQAKKCILDYLGVTFAGAKLISEKGNQFLEQFNSKDANASVLGFNQKSNTQNAALINGLSSHIAELDDGNRHGMVHPGTTVISALFAVAEKEGLDGSGFLNGVVVGYESVIRLAKALQPELKKKGYHATALCGSIGSALGIAAALNYTKYEMKNVLSAAATSSSGMLNVIRDGSDLKPFNAGQAALNGVLAVYIGRAGFRGSNDVLNGYQGFLSLITSEIKLSELEDAIGEVYGIEQIYMKPYAACRHAHPAIEAVINLKKKYKLSSEGIKKINVYTYKLAVIGHDHTAIEGITSAKMSIPFSVAVALETGKAGLSEFTPERIADLKVIELTKKVKVSDDENLSAQVPQFRPAIVEIVTHGGGSFRERVDLPKGEPETPLTDEEVKEKFVSLAQYAGLPEKDGNELIRRVWEIEENFNKLLETL